MLRPVTMFCVLLALGCEGEPDAATVGPISDECNRCLSLEDGGQGCAATTSACLEVEACNEAALCLLWAGCFEEPAEGECRSRHGCEAGDAGGSLLAGFEGCARTTCRAICGFDAP